ncbi:MAG TPA: oligosaccharide flippase family protein [Humisphaera sp.]|jgi:PST family polysaccharide transporter|nr:oligosaccharide flippase family protein [Humisphaera sp.]
MIETARHNDMADPPAEPLTELPRPAPQNARPTYGHHAARGLASNFISSLIVKGVSFAGQVVVAWNLSKHDMGLAATAMAASIFPAQIKEFGIAQLLMRHPKRYAAWSADAFWLEMVLGFICVIVTGLMCAVWSAKSTGVIGPLMLMSFGYWITAPAAVPFAKLSMDLRFVLIARLNTLMTIASTVASIVLAILGFGPYALVLPILLAAILRASAGFFLSPVKILRQPHWSRWRVMLGDGWKLTLTFLLFQVVWQCDYLVLDATNSVEQVGIYFFAFQLSSQMLTLLSQSLAGVLLPVLGHLRGDSTRQLSGFLRAARYLCAIGIPLCFLQAGVADPLLRVIWHEKWVEAIPALQALSIGTAFRLLGVPSTSLLIAQGRLNAYLISAAISAIGFLAIITFAAHLGAATSMAVGVAIFYSIMETGIAIVAIGGGTAGWFSRGLEAVKLVLSPPVFSGLVGGAVGFAAAHFVSVRLGAMPALLIGSASGFAASMLAIRSTSKEMFLELLALPRSFIAGVQRG